MANKLPTRAESGGLAKRVMHMYKNVFDKDSKKTWLHFRQEGCCRTTIKRYIKRFEESGDIKFKKSPGPKPKVVTPQKLKTIEKYFEENPSTTVIAAAKKLNLNKGYLQKIKVHKLGIKARAYTTKESTTKNNTKVQRRKSKKQVTSGSNKFPAGSLELVYDLEKGNVENALDAFVFYLHWSVIRTGLRQRSSENSAEFTERLPPNWHQHQDETSGPTRILTQTYYDPHNPELKYELKIIELISNDLVAVTLFRSPKSTGVVSKNPPSSSDKNSGTEKSSAASTFHITSFIRSTAFQEGQSRDKATDVFEHTETLETQLNETIMQPLGLRTMGQPPLQAGYDNPTKSTKKPTAAQRNSLTARFSHHDLGRGHSALGRFPGPHHVGPVGNVPGGLGRSDLDPFGGFGAGNILDPRTGIPCLFPGSNQSGSRFDAFNPTRPNGGTGSFAIHERPNLADYDDMFI